MVDLRLKSSQLRVDIAPIEARFEAAVRRDDADQVRAHTAHGRELVRFAGTLFDAAVKEADISFDARRAFSAAFDARFSVNVPDGVLDDLIERLGPGYLG